MFPRWFYFRLGKPLSLPSFNSYFRLNSSYQWSVSRQIPYSRPKLSDFYTLSQTKLLENHTLHSGTYPYSLYMRVPPGHYKKLFYGLLRKRARWSESCVLIGYPSGQDGPILPARDFPLCSRKSEILWCQPGFWPYNKFFIDQVCLVKMAGYWPRLFFRFYGPRLRLGPAALTSLGQ